MKTKSLLLGLALSPWLMLPAHAEEPPDDRIVQETLEELQSRGFDRLPDADAKLGPGVSADSLIARQLLEAEAWVKSERLSRNDITVYEVNRKLPGNTNVVDLLPAETRAQISGDPNLPLSSVSEYIEVVDVRVGGKTVKYVRTIPPDEVAKLKAGGGAAAKDMANLARTQAVGSVIVGAVLQKAAKDSPFGSFFMKAPNADQVTSFVTNADAYCHVLSIIGAEEENKVYGAGYLDPGIELWTSINPMTFMTGQACFLLAAADAFESLGNNFPRESAQQIASAVERAKQALKYQGAETVDGRPTYKVAVEDVGGQLFDMGQQVGQQASGSQPGAGDPEIKVTAIYRYIDAEYLVPRKLRMEGVMEADGQSREFFLEKLEQDYRNVPDSSLYEPYRTVLRMGGMLSPEQQAEMRKSQGKLDEFERRMASMPASERAMTERMMGDKLKQWRSLANGGAVEFEIITTSIVINPDFSASGGFMTPPAEPEEAATTRVLSPEELRAAQLACLQERAAAAQQAEKKKRGLGRLASAVTRTAARLGDSSIGRVAGDLFSAGQTADDLVAAAEDLGLTEDDAEACRQP